MTDPAVKQRGRLIAFYAKYNPDKLATVDEALAKFAGTEDTVMWPTLISKYGPEPPMDYRARLVRFYQSHNPEKLANIDQALSSFKGKEEEMFTALVLKYGPEPLPTTTTTTAAPTTTAASAAPPAAAAPAENPHRARLVAYYQQYNPDKLGSVDATLAKFAGREEEMFEALVAKYGPEPGRDAPASGATASGSSSYRDRLVAFYTKYNPEKLPTVDSTLAKFAGREEEMFEALVGKYGPEPGQASASSSTDYRSRLVAFYTKYNPDKLSSVDATLSKFVGREEEMFEALVGKYGPEPSSSATAETATDYRTRLVAFYTKYNPEKLGSVDTTLAKYVGREEVMFETLVAKYGPEPSSGAPLATRAPAAAAVDYKTRLIAFYTKYNPEKLPTVDATLAKFAGREEEMFEALVTKYGPEPGPDQPHEPARAVSGANYLARLIAFYQAYNPSKVGDADATLAKFAGREEDMFKALVAKYGPEPSSMQNAAAAPAGSSSYAARLTAFYAKYNPDKVGSVASTLAKFAGREEEMFGALVAKYGPEPEVPAGGASDYKTRLTAFYTKYNPEKLGSVDSTLAKYVGREEEMFEALVAKYGPEPSEPVVAPAAHRSENLGRLIAFYEKYQPEKVSGAAAVLEKFAGRESDMFKQLVAKYGPEPVTAVPLSAPLAEPTTPPAATSRAAPTAAGESHPQQQAPKPTTPRVAPAPAPIQQIMTLPHPSAKRPLSTQHIQHPELALKAEEEARALIEAIEDDQRSVALDHFERVTHKLILRAAVCELAVANQAIVRRRVFAFWRDSRDKLKEARKERRKIAYETHIEKLKTNLDLTPYQRLALESKTLQHVASERAGLGSPTSPRTRLTPKQQQQQGPSPGRGSIVPGVVRSTAALYELAGPQLDSEPSTPMTGAPPPAPQRSSSASGLRSAGSTGALRPRIASPTSPLEQHLRRADTSSFSRHASQNKQQQPAAAARGTTATSMTALLEEHHAGAIEAMSDLDKAKLARRLSKWNLAVPPSISGGSGSIAPAGSSGVVRSNSDVARSASGLRRVASTSGPAVPARATTRGSAAALTPRRSPTSPRSTSASGAGGGNAKEDEAFMAAVLYESFSRQP